MALCKHFLGVIFLFEIKIAQILRKYGKWLQV